MKTLIVATDFSKEAENAAEYACSAAKLMKTKVLLFNSFSIPLHVSNARLPASVFKELLENNTLALKNRATELSEKYSVEVEYESSFVQLGDELNALFAKHEAKMVIMGTSARSLDQDLFGNSNTTAILKLRFPVLAIPNGVSFRPIKRILYACDVLRGINVRILNEIKDVAAIMDAEVEIFHVQNNLRKLESNSNEIVDTEPITDALEGVSHYYKNIESETIIDEIKNEIARINADLLIMVPQRYGFWQSLTHRSKTRIMASQSDVPLLSIPI